MPRSGAGPACLPRRANRTPEQIEPHLGVHAQIAGSGAPVLARKGAVLCATLGQVTVVRFAWFTLAWRGWTAHGRGH